MEGYKHYFDLKRIPLIDLEELHESIRIEIINRQLRPMRYEVEALRKQIIDMKEFIERNI